MLSSCKSLHVMNKNINWRLIFEMMFLEGNPSIYIPIYQNITNVFYRNVIINLCNPKCCICGKMTSLFNVETVMRICSKCHEDKINNINNIVPAVDSWLFGSMPDFIISDRIKSGKYGNCVVTCDFKKIIKMSNKTRHKNKYGYVVHIMKDVVIKEKFYEYLPLFYKPVKIVGLSNENTGEKCRIILQNSSIVFCNSSVIENLDFVSGPKEHGHCNPPDAENAYPCIQTSSDYNVANGCVKYHVIIRNCSISARMGTGILVNSSHQTVTVMNNKIYNCGYAGICFNPSNKKFDHVENNIITGNASWGIQHDASGDGNKVIEMKKMNVMYGNGCFFFLEKIDIKTY